ncbi:MAG TPA: GGDEF domain-containing protein [Acidimicrobiia bacterium]|nr:GGDEF domain-containing protein [Acidimicrobiia bacterium]
MTPRDETLSRLDSIQARSLARLQEGGTDRALLVELLEAACLLELAKIETTRVDPASYLQHAIDVVAQMYPVRGAAATVSVPGGEPIEVHAGEVGAGDRRYPLVGDGVTYGVFVAGELKTDLGSPDDFLQQVAAQIARGFAGVVHSEHLRREAATATAARVASQLPDENIVEGLEELALALASFPSVIAAELVIDHIAVGPPLKLRSGYWDYDGHPHSLDSITLDLGAVGRLTTRIRSVDESPPDEVAVQSVMEHLASSLDRIATTQALREQAETEPLTGLGNRRRLQRALDQHLARAQRYDERVALLLLDLDRFKAVNDELGHETGDGVIVACAEALRERTRGYDELVRLGGDEFVVVAPVPDVLHARRIAEDLRTHIALRCNALLPADWGLSAAIGVAVFPDAALDPESLLRAADIALYRAKELGHEGVVVAEPAAPDIAASITRTPRTRRGPTPRGRE